MNVSSAAVEPAVTVAGSLQAPTSVEARITEAQWTEYVSRHPDATVDHLWGWRDVFTRVFRQQCVYLAARRDGRVVGVLPLVCFRSVLFGRSVVSVPYLNYGGLLASDAEAAAALISEAGLVARDFGATHVELRHRQRHAPNLPFRQHKVGMVLPLPASSEDLWKAIDRKVRNQVRKAQKDGLTCVSGGVDLLDEFYQVFAVNMRDLGTPVYSKQLFAETLRAFPADASVYVVRSQGRPVAASVAVRFRESVLVPWASALREFRHSCPNMLLYWSMLEHAVAVGAATFDFGRSTRHGGTFQFKQQWGAEEVPMFWEYLLLTRAEAPDHGPGNRRFGMVIEGWKQLPLWLANRVGPWIVRNIP